jgi:hypothetical protein
MTYKIKLQPGDYCRRYMGEDKYREVAQRFFDDGCAELERFAKNQRAQKV